MFNPSGIGTLIISRKARSSALTSIKRLCTLISYRSHVAVPLPQGDFLVVIFNFLVGRGIGPRISTPVVWAISFIPEQIWLTLSMSMLASLMRARCAIFNYLPCTFVNFLVASQQ